LEERQATWSKQSQHSFKIHFVGWYEFKDQQEGFPFFKFTIPQILDLWGLSEDLGLLVV
jgi:hypothetical protein